MFENTAGSPHPGAVSGYSQAQSADQFRQEQARFVNEQLAALKQRVYDSEERIRQLEKHIHYPHNETAMKEAAAKAQAHLLAQVDKPHAREHVMSQAASIPMRTDVEAILTMTAFCKRLLEPRDLAYAVTLEVRNEARRALGLKEREV